MSNRLPFVLCRRKQERVLKYNKEDEDKRSSDKGLEPLYRKPSAGGLVTAVAPVIVQSGGNSKNTHKNVQNWGWKLY